MQKKFSFPAPMLINLVRYTFNPQKSILPQFLLLRCTTCGRNALRQQLWQLLGGSTLALVFLQTVDKENNQHLSVSPVINGGKPKGDLASDCSAEADSLFLWLPIVGSERLRGAAAFSGGVFCFWLHIRSDGTFS